MHSPSSRGSPSLCSFHPDDPSPSAFCDAVDTHDHSKKKKKKSDDDDGGREAAGEGSVRDFSFFRASLVKYFLRRLARFAWLRYYDCRKFRSERETERAKGEGIGAGQGRDAERRGRRDEEEEE